MTPCTSPPGRTTPYVLSPSSPRRSGSTYHTVEELAEAQRLPVKFLEAILTQLRRSGLLESRRGATGGFRLARPASEISVADVMRAVDGPLAAVRGLRPEDTAYDGAAMSLPARVDRDARCRTRRPRVGQPGRRRLRARCPSTSTSLTSDDSAWHRR